MEKCSWENETKHKNIMMMEERIAETEEEQKEKEKF